jgi:hypothetical protein
MTIEAYIYLAGTVPAAVIGATVAVLDGGGEEDPPGLVGIGVAIFWPLILGFFVLAGFTWLLGSVGKICADVVDGKRRRALRLSELERRSEQLERDAGLR